MSFASACEKEWSYISKKIVPEFNDFNSEDWKVVYRHFDLPIIAEGDDDVVQKICDKLRADLLYFKEESFADIFHYEHMIKILSVGGLIAESWENVEDLLTKCLSYKIESMDLLEIEALEYFDYSGFKSFGYYYDTSHFHARLRDTCQSQIVERKEFLLVNEFEELVFSQLGYIDLWDFLGQFVVNNSGKLPQRYLEREVFHEICASKFASRLVELPPSLCTSFIFGIDQRYKHTEFTAELRWWGKVGEKLEAIAEDCSGLRKLQLMTLSKRANFLSEYGDIRKGIKLNPV